MNKINVISKPGYYSLRNRLRRLEMTQHGEFKAMHMYDKNDIDTLLSKVKESTDVDAFYGFLKIESTHSQVRKIQMNRLTTKRKEDLTRKYTAVSVVNAETTNSYYAAVRCTIVNWSDTNGTLLYDKILKPKEEIVNIRGSVSKEDVIKKGKDVSLEMPKIMELLKDKTIITHNKPELIFGLDLVKNQPKILDLATNNDVNYFIMSLTDNRFKGVKSLQDQAMFVFNTTSESLNDSIDYTKTMISIFNFLASHGREPDI